MIKRRMARREFLASIGTSFGGSVMLRVMAALGLGTSLNACGSSSASPAPNPPVSPPPPSMLQSPRPGDWPANVGAGRTVAILGGGLAGMTAALEMTRLGYTCTVLEAQPQAGGRITTIRSGDVVNETDSTQTCLFDVDPDLYFNAGPSRIPHHHEFLLGYCREFGIALETFTNDNRAALLHGSGSFGGQPLPARQVIADTRGNIARLLATAVNQNALDMDLSATDKTNILQMLSVYGDLDGSFGYTGSERAGFPDQEDVGSRRRGELLSPLDLSELIADTLYPIRTAFAHGLDQQPTMLQPVGGMDRIARAFETQVLSSLVFDAVVTEIRRLSSGVRIVYDRLGASNTLVTDYAVIAIPATVLASIPSDFSTAHRNEIAGFQYTSAVRVAFQSRRFWEQDHNIYGGISWTDRDITQIWYPNHGFGSQNGIVLGAYAFGGPAGDTLTNQTPAARIDTVTQQANDVHPEFQAEVSRGLSVAWEKVPLALGGWGTSTPNVLLTEDDRFFFAGEHLSILQGWQEGAILSAYSAIDQVVTRDTA